MACFIIIEILSFFRKKKRFSNIYFHIYICCFLDFTHKWYLDKILTRMKNCASVISLEILSNRGRTLLRYYIFLVHFIYDELKFSDEQFTYNR